MKTIMIIFFLMSIVSCSLLFDHLNDQENEYYELPGQLKSGLQKGDILVYESSNGETDSLFMVLKLDGTIRYTLTGTEGKEPYETWEFQALYFTVTNDSLALSKTDLADYMDQTEAALGDLLNNVLPDSDEYIRMTIGYYDISSDSNRDFSPCIDWYNLKSSGFTRYEIPDSFRLNNKTYDNVYINSLEPGFSADLKKLWVSKDFGIIQYELSDGTTWSLK